MNCKKMSALIFTPSEMYYVLLVKTMISKQLVCVTVQVIHNNPLFIKFMYTVNINCILNTCKSKRIH